jgi:hypothetical protein
MPLLRPRVGSILLCGCCLQGCIQARESAGQAEVGFQQYYLAIGAQRILNISGLTLTSTEFFPGVGVVNASLAPAVSNNQFRTGDDYLRLKGLPWKGQHWTFTAGDFRIPGQLLAVPFSNIYFPEIAARGGAMEATHGDRTIGFFSGQETISNTPRVILRQQVPQTVMGAYIRQKIGNRWLVGARFMHVATDLVALAKLPNLLAQNRFKTVTSLFLDSLYTIFGPLKLYGEATWSIAQQDVPSSATRNVPVSTLVGPIFDTRLFTFRANYTFENASYFPLLGYYLGDREGPYVEAKFDPFTRLEIYGSAGKYENNVARDPTLPTFQNSSETAGASAQLPAKISLTAQVTLLALASRANAASPWVKAKDRQELVTLARSFGRHTIRIAARDFSDLSPLSSQRQRALEIDDNCRLRHLTLGGGVRVQRLIAGGPRNTMFYRGSAQFSAHRFSAYGNFETGSDLQNKTLFATNTVSTTVLGASMTAGKNWEFQFEAYRNNLITELNPESIFVLQGQGVFIPGTLADLNQWSIYFRAIRRFRWGAVGEVGDVNSYALRRAPLKGSVEGFVMERLADGNQPAEGVSVIIDGRAVVTDADGRFQFPDVPEGTRKVLLALHELPAEFDPGKVIEIEVLVRPDKRSRADLDVIRLGLIEGKVTGPPDVSVEDAVIRMLPGERYTTPDSEGAFYFYNLREGDYEVVLDKKTLPEFAAMEQAERVSVSLKVGQQPEPINFQFEVKPPEKPVRNVLDK